MKFEIYDNEGRIHQVPGDPCEVRGFEFLQLFVHPVLGNDPDDEWGVTKAPRPDLGFRVSEATTGRGISPPDVAYPTKREAIKAAGVRLREIGLAKVKGHIPVCHRMYKKMKRRLLNPDFPLA